MMRDEADDAPDTDVGETLSQLYVLAEENSVCSHRSNTYRCQSQDLGHLQGVLSWLIL